MTADRYQTNIPEWDGDAWSNSPHGYPDDAAANRVEEADDEKSALRHAIRVQVKDKANGRIRQFDVNAEVEVNYFAYEVEDQPEVSQEEVSDEADGD